MAPNPLRVVADVALVVIVAACGRRSAGAPVPESSIDRTVYGAVTNAVLTAGLPDTLLVAESTLVFRSVSTGAADPRVPLDTVPLGLRTRLAEVSLKRSASRALPLPLPIRIVTDSELRSIFQRGPMDGWPEFYRRYPKQRSWYAFSPVAFSADRLQAYVYYEYNCGDVCGGGEGFWFVRSRNDSTWRVRLRVMYWVS